MCRGVVIVFVVVVVVVVGGGGGGGGGGGDGDVILPKFLSCLVASLVCLMCNFAVYWTVHRCDN